MDTVTYVFPHREKIKKAPKELIEKLITMEENIPRWIYGAFKHDLDFEDFYWPRQSFQYDNPHLNLNRLAHEENYMFRKLDLPDSYNYIAKLSLEFLDRHPEYKPYFYVEQVEFDF